VAVASLCAAVSSLARSSAILWPVESREDEVKEEVIENEYLE